MSKDDLEDPLAPDCEPQRDLCNDLMELMSAGLRDFALIYPDPNEARDRFLSTLTIALCIATAALRADPRQLAENGLDVRNALVDGTPLPEDHLPLEVPQSILQLISAAEHAARLAVDEDSDNPKLLN